VPPNRFFLNSSFGQSALLRRRQAGPALFLHPGDAAARGIVPGDLVAVANDRGRALFTAVLTDDTPAGQVVAEGIWWHKFMPGGRGVNVLTTDRVADMGGGPAFHSTMSIRSVKSLPKLSFDSSVNLGFRFSSGRGTILISIVCDLRFAAPCAGMRF
jgi:anaerobic selenocysteine-containing dehydrogenase